jgi:hypothetical protein
VPERVVDLLEPVQVELDQGHDAVAAGRDRAVDVLAQLVPGGQVGQLVVVRRVPEPGDQLLVLQGRGQPGGQVVRDLDVLGAERGEVVQPVLELQVTQRVRARPERDGDDLPGAAGLQRGADGIRPPGGDQEAGPAAQRADGERVGRVERRRHVHPAVAVHGQRQGRLGAQPQRDPARVEDVAGLVEGRLQRRVGGPHALQHPAERVHPAEAGVLPVGPGVSPVGQQQHAADGRQQDSGPAVHAHDEQDHQRDGPVEQRDQRRQQRLRADGAQALRALGDGDDRLDADDGQHRDRGQRDPDRQPRPRVGDVIDPEQAEDRRRDRHLGTQQRDVERGLHRRPAPDHGDQDRRRHPDQQQDQRADHEQPEHERDLGQTDGVGVPAELDVQEDGLGQHERHEQGADEPQRRVAEATAQSEPGQPPHRDGEDAQQRREQRRADARAGIASSHAARGLRHADSADLRRPRQDATVGPEA